VKHLKVLVVCWEAPFPSPPLFTPKSTTSIDCQLQENCVMNLSIFIIFYTFDNYSIHLQAYHIGGVPTEINYVITCMDYTGKWIVQTQEYKPISFLASQLRKFGACCILSNAWSSPY